jgi:peptidyl-prolyl cis-trans isomerase SurA
VSDVVETPIGFHLVQAVEKRGDQVNCRHILVRVEKSDLDEKKVLERAEGLRTRILAGEDFAHLAKTFSDDSTSRDQGGALGEFTLEDIQIEAFRNAVDSLEAGEVSRPFLTQFGIHLVRLEARKGARRYNLEEDYDTFRGRALDMKMQKLRKAWIEDLKKTVYIDVKQDML